MGDKVLPEILRKSLDETKVEYHQLGKCGLKVSCPILGAMSFGSKEWQPWVMDDETEVQNLLKAAYDCGLNTWDTANVYSNGVSETMVGKSIQRFSIPRHKLVILTKCFGIVGEEPEIWDMKYGSEMKRCKDYVNQYGLSRAAIFNAVDMSLSRLQTNYIDLLQIHRFDPNVPIEETMRALHDLVQWGKVRYIGASSMYTHQFVSMQACAERHNWTKFVSMQNQYSLCYREEEREMISFCQQTGVGLIPWSPLYRGRLSRPLGEVTTRESSLTSNPTVAKLSEADQEIIRRVQQIADKEKWTMSQVALLWVIHKGATPIVGVNSLSRLDAACDVRDKRLRDEDIKYLEEPYKPKPISGH